MIAYLPLLKETLDRKHIKYFHKERLLVFTRKYGNGREDDLQMRFVFLLLPADMMVVVSIQHALRPEQIATAEPLFEEANKDLQLGEFGTDNQSNCVCFRHLFESPVGEEWDAEAKESAQEFIVDYTTEIVPPILLGVFDRATGYGLGDSRGLQGGVL